jgi:xanthosine utilization system XapX-like protein
MKMKIGKKQKKIMIIGIGVVMGGAYLIAQLGLPGPVVLAIVAAVGGLYIFYQYKKKQEQAAGQDKEDK